MPAIDKTFRARIRVNDLPTRIQLVPVISEDRDVRTMCLDLGCILWDLDRLKQHRSHACG